MTGLATQPLHGASPLAGTGAPQSPHAGSSPTLIIEAARVFTGREMVRDARIVVVGDTIAAVLPGGAPELRQPDPALDGGSCQTLRFPHGTVLPGLIDAHVHLALLARAELRAAHPRRSSRAQDPAADDPLVGAAVRVADAYLARGVTTLRDMGDRQRVNLEVRQRLRTRARPGPRVLAPGRALHREGSYGHFFGVAANGVGELLALAESELEAGAGFIKVVASGIIDFKRGTADAPLPFSVAELRALVEFARWHGVPVAAHASGTAGVAAALAAGVDTIEHGYFAAEAELDAFAGGAATWVPTFIPVQVVAAGAAAAAVGELSEPERARIHRILERHAAGVGRVVAAGGAVLAGSDAGSPGVWEAGGIGGELRCLGQAGLSPASVLASATRGAARALGIDHLVGSIECGKRADLLVVNGDPVRTLDALRDVRLVLRDGTPVRRLPNRDELAPERAHRAR